MSNKLNKDTLIIMARKFITADYDATLDITVRLGDVIPPNHLARFIVDVIALLDLSTIYARYGTRGAPPYAPEILLALLFYGYATGIFSSRKIEQATYEALPFIFIAGNMHPDHDTIANFRKNFLKEIEELFVQILLIAYEAGILKLGNISIDGTKIHADASKSHAVSYDRLPKMEAQLQQEIEQLIELGSLADKGKSLPEGISINEEIIRRQERLGNLAEAKVVLEKRAQERFEIEQVAYQTVLKERDEKERVLGRKLLRSKPLPPQEGPRDKDQYNFTDPDSHLMKNSNNNGFEQHYNAQVAVDYNSLLIVGNSLSNHPNDQGEIESTLDTIPSQLGIPDAASLDNGYFSEANIELLETRGIDPYIATGRIPHFLSLPEVIASYMEPQHTDQTKELSNADSLVTTTEETDTETEETSKRKREAITTDNSSLETSDIELSEELSSTEAEDKLSDIDSILSQNQSSEEPASDNEPSAKLQMASKLKTEAGQAIYRLRKCTVEPVIGIIKETIGFRQFSLRGLEATTGSFHLTCLAFNLKRLHKLTEGELCFSYD